MSLRVRVVLTVLCAVAAFAAMAAYAAGVRGEAAGQRRDALERYGGETARVYVATREIGKGETFSERNVAPMEWLVDLLPQGAVAADAEVLGKTAVAAIAENTPLSSVDVDVAGDPLDVPAGLVALSVPCTNEGAVGGALASGSVVDVYAVIDGAARLLSPEVRVLQTNAEGTAASLSWATLAVEPSEVQALVAASAVHRLYFALPSAEEIQSRSLHPDAFEAVGTAGAGELPPDAVGGVGPVYQEAPEQQVSFEEDVGEPVQGWDGEETGDDGALQEGEA